ncbi:hypothetical protein FOA52_010585 [Chlamydomonas sp. UWO 241]|nr:hypothetical protein FOA52_010585 [Chlamydomonas sp. UWO 241]
MEGGGRDLSGTQQAQPGGRPHAGHAGAMQPSTPPAAVPHAGDGAGAGPEFVALAGASQPDYVRAVQKDDLYKQIVVDACHEATRQVLGPYAALHYGQHSRAAALLLYYGLTTGCGIPTLGEEYCNMAQVVEGAYYQAAHRVLRVRYASTYRATAGPPPTYRALGWLLMLQLGVAGVAGVAAAWRARTSAVATGVG